MRYDSSTFLVGGAILVAVVMAVAQEVNKEWTIHQNGSSDELQFTVRRRTATSQWTISENVPRSRFQGLSLDTIEHGGAAKFEYVQDAGTLACVGRFSFGRGSGDYTFKPNPEFAAELRRLGYEAPDAEQQFTMLVDGVSLDFARGVREAKLHASTTELIKLRTHGVSLEYINALQQIGYNNLLARDVIDLRIHGVRPEFLRELKDAGYNISAAEAIDLAIHGVDSEYLRQLRSYGVRPAPSELVQLRIHGVTPEYLSGLKDAGYEKLSTDEIVQLRIHGVDAKFVREAQDLGYRFTAGELVQLRNHGVNGAYLRNLRDSGMRNLTAEQIEKLRMHGIE